MTEYFEFNDKLRDKVLSDFSQLGDFEPVSESSTRYHPVYDKNQPQLLTQHGLISTTIDNEPPEIKIRIQNSLKHEDMIEGIQQVLLQRLAD